MTKPLEPTEEQTRAIADAFGLAPWSRRAVFEFVRDMVLEAAAERILRDAHGGPSGSAICRAAEIIRAMKGTP